MTVPTQARIERATTLAALALFWFTAWEVWQFVRTLHYWLG